jgi:mono/diheme cytochrome c family protein
MPLPKNILLCCWLSLSISAISATEPVTYEKDVRPILKAHCFHCHGESGTVEGSLDLRLRHYLMSGGDSGPAIAPGAPKESLLLARVESAEMPPGENQRLSDREIQTLRLWIEQGAPTARPEPTSLADSEYWTEEERGFWAFQPIERPAIPRLAVEAESVSKTKNQVHHNAIDAFIAQQLKQQGLEFSPAADRATMIRRLSFDLLGLPPAPLEVAEFQNDASPAAYERLVERYLANPAYGQRWGRHWLDVAGYADSEGYTNQDKEREFAYFYRDYVVRSLNRNLPLDQFIVEQLAGDELPCDVGSTEEPVPLSPQRIEHLTATGFLRMAPDGTADSGANRDEAVNETISDTLQIVSSALLGLTVGCARCHDHRYDPISQADYYRLRAIFAPALDWQQWKTPVERQVSLYTPQDHRLRTAVEERAKLAEAARTARQQEHLDRTLEEELLVAPDARREALRTAYQTSKEMRTAEQVALLEEFPNIANISPGSLYLYAEQRARRAGDIDRAREERAQLWIARIREEHLQNVPSQQHDELLAAVHELSQLADQDNPRKTALLDLAAEFPGVFVTEATLAQFDPSAAETLQRYRQAAEQCRQLDAKTELAQLQTEIAEIRATAPKENFLQALVEPHHHLPTTHLFIRGDHQQPAQVVEPAELGVLRAASGLAEAQTFASDDPSLPTSGRRLAYARHLTSGRHPLVARVLVNRVWYHHFGRGIVEPVADFGMLGARPSHPRLLDWLADELMRSGWDLKHIHRLILTSRTYQQSSTRTAHLDHVDPDNRWLARMSVRRLESEAVRDSILAVSGVLSSEMDGPPVPVKEDGVGQIVLGKEMLDGERKPTGADPGLPGAARRSLYVQVRRTRPLATLETFDIATPSPNCLQRSFSNVAMQPLMMMNSQFILEHADQLAQRVVDTHSGLNEQLRNAWIYCYSSEPTANQLEQLRTFVERQSAEFQKQDSAATVEKVAQQALASLCHALLSANAFVYVD